MRKRFLVFAGQEFYPNGGANDLVSTTPQTKEEAIEHAKSLIGKTFSTNFWCEEVDEPQVTMTVEWSHVFDLLECEIIFREGKIFGDESGIIIL